MQRFAHPLDSTRTRSSVALPPGWACGDLAGTRDIVWSAKPRTAPKRSAGQRAHVPHSPALVWLHPAHHPRQSQAPRLPLEARGLYRLAQEVQHNKVWPQTLQVGPRDPHPLSPPRPGPALPARSLEAQTLTSLPAGGPLPPPLRPLPPRVGGAQGCLVLGVPGSIPAAPALRAPLPPDGGQLPCPTPTRRRAALPSGPLL